LALMDPEEVTLLTSDLVKLAAARDRKSSGVYERCRDLLLGYKETSKVLGRFAASQPSAWRNAGATKDQGKEADETFQRMMQDFLRSSHSEAFQLAQLCRRVFECYWSFAVFCEEPAAIFPPPRQQTDTAQDIFVLFFGFLEAAFDASKKLRVLGLREEIARARNPPSEEPVSANAEAATALPQQQRPAILITPASDEAGAAEANGVQSTTTKDSTSGTNAASDLDTLQVPSPLRRRAATGTQRLRLGAPRGGNEARRRLLTAVEDEDGGPSDVSDWEHSRSPAHRKCGKTPGTSKTGGTAPLPQAVSSTATSHIGDPFKLEANPAATDAPPPLQTQPELVTGDVNDQGSADLLRPLQTQPSLPLPTEAVSVAKAPPQRLVAGQLPQSPPQRRVSGLVPGGGTRLPPTLPAAAGSTEAMGEEAAPLRCPCPQRLPISSSSALAQPLLQSPPQWHETIEEQQESGRFTPPSPAPPPRIQRPSQRDSRRETLRKSLSQAADRAESKALKRLSRHRFADGCHDGEGCTSDADWTTS